MDVIFNLITRIYFEYVQETMLSLALPVAYVSILIGALSHKKYLDWPISHYSLKERFGNGLFFFGLVWGMITGFACLRLIVEAVLYPVANPYLLQALGSMFLWFVPGLASFLLGYRLTR